MFSCIKEPASQVITRIYFNDVKEICQKYRIDYDFVYESAKRNRNQYEEFSKSIANNLSDNLEYITKKFIEQGVTTPEQLTINIRNLTNLLEATFSFMNFKRFVYDSSYNDHNHFIMSPKQDTAIDFLDFFDRVEDCILDFKFKGGYANYMIRLSRCDYEITCHKGANMPAIVIAVLTNDKGRIRTICQFHVVKGIYPKLLVDPTTTLMKCANDFSKCKRCVKLDTEVYLKSLGFTDSSTFCYVIPKKIEQSACSLCVVDPYKILNILAYVWDMYEHRNTLVRKNAKRLSAYNTRKVSIQHLNNEGAFVTVPLQQQYIYERDRKEWQGGHHNSPRMHERAAHTRRIFNKDGTLKRVVQVKSSTVNADSSPTVYRIKETK